MYCCFSFSLTCINPGVPSVIWDQISEFPAQSHVELLKTHNKGNENMRTVSLLTDNCHTLKDIEFQAVLLKTTICLSDEYYYLKCAVPSLLFSEMNKWREKWFPSLITDVQFKPCPSVSLNAKLWSPAR